MIDSRKRFAQVIRKQLDGAWRIENINEAIADIYIATIDLHLSFDDIYRNSGL